MKNLLISIIAFFAIATTYSVNKSVPEWGATGHRTVGEIAEKHLSKKAKRNIKDLLGSDGLALVSTFADDIKSDSRYDEFYTWHYINMPLNVTYENSKKSETGDLITGIETCKKILLDETTSKDDKIFYLKMLIHFIGDLHQPLHVGRAEDKGGNSIEVSWFNGKTNLHAVWDSKMINQFDMSYTELTENASELSKQQVKYLQKGSIIDWANETQQLAKKVYESAENGDKLYYRYMYDYFEIARKQLQVGGVRLAKVLNEIFG